MIHADFAENHAPDVIAYFSKPDGSLLNAGERLVQQPYAEFLRRLAAQGPAALYAGIDRGQDRRADPRRAARPGR